MAKVWMPYVPVDVLADIAAHPDESLIGRERRTTAVALFADVSGFTAMSEALGRTGRQGTEELTQILNGYFEPMIDRVESYGGIVGKFGGDAMTVLFPYNDGNRAAVVRRALICAVQMQADMTRYQDIPTSAGAYSLAMKVGLAQGTVYLTTVGDADERLEFIIAGDVIDACSDAEHHAERGDVIAQTAMLDAAPEATIGTVFEDGFTQVTGFDANVAGVPLLRPDEAPEGVTAALEKFVHPSIAARLRIARSDFVDEHRRVTVLFVNFAGFDYDDDPDIGTKLQTYSAEVVRTVARYGGYLNKIDMGDKGSKYIVLFGAPISYENDEERALRCAIELRDLGIAQAIPTKIGVNTGAVFAGHVGAVVRREYTVMGDAVNLSARLMQACPVDSVLASGTTHDDAPAAFDWVTLDPITVKGKSEPIAVYRLEGVRPPAEVRLQPTAYALPMVGRADELARITALLDEAIAGRGQVIAVSGDAGMGKSRLTAEVIRTAFERDMVGYGGAAQSFNTNIGYVAWNTIWRGYFDLDPAAPTAAQIHDLSEKLATIDPALVERLPLLGAVLNLPIPDNALTAPLEPDVRQELRHALLLDLLRRRAAESPVLLVIEDAQWLDPLSRALLADITRGISGLEVAVLVAHRPLNTADDPLLPTADHVTQMALGAFAPDEVAALVRLKLADVAPPADLTNRIAEFSGGNPFYVDELMNLLADRGIDVTDPESLQAVALPDSLYNLILSRVDELSEDEKTVLKVASVIGRSFRASWVTGYYPDIGPYNDVLRQLNRLETLELTPLDRPEPELEYLFKHILTRDVAYDSLSYALRADLHARVGRYIESRYSGELEGFAYLLAFHYGTSRDTDKQRIYYRMAGDLARRDFMNAAAEDYYQRLLPLVTDDETTRGDVLYALGQVWGHVGQWEQAIDAYRESLAIAERADDRSRMAYRRDALGDLLSYQDSNDEALTLMEQAVDDFTVLGDDDGLNTALKHLSYLHMRRGDWEGVRGAAERQLALADDNGDNIARCDAAQNLGVVEMFTGDINDALRWLRLAADAADRVGYRQGAIYALGNLSGAYTEVGDFAAALDSLEQALSRAEAIDYARSAAVITGNRGHIYEQTGQYDDALTCYQDALDKVTALGDMPQVQLFTGNIGQIRYKQGNYVEASRAFTRAIDLDATLNMPYYLSEYLLWQARTLRALGGADEAVPLAAQAVALADEHGADEVAFGARVLAIVLDVERDAIDASEGINRLDALESGDDDPVHLADLAYERAWLDPENLEARVIARDRYADVYRQSPNADYLRRFVAMGGDPLDLPPLPTLPPVTTPAIQ